MPHPTGRRSAPAAVCGIPPGNYEITAPGPSSTARASFAIATADAQDVEVDVPPMAVLSGETTWDGPAPVSSTKVTVRALPLDRVIEPVTDGGWNEEQGVQSQVAGPFSFPEMPLGDYEVSVSGLGSGQYVKDVLYGGWSVLHVPLRLGSALGSGALRVVLARDGGALVVQVNDSQNRPVSDAYVYAMPAASKSEAALAAEMTFGQTDQAGQYVVDGMPPGKYFLVTYPRAHSHSTNGVDELWRARTTKATEVEVTSGITRLATLTLSR